MLAVLGLLSIALIGSSLLGGSHGTDDDEISTDTVEEDLPEEGEISLDPSGAIEAELGFELIFGQEEEIGVSLPETLEDRAFVEGDEADNHLDGANGESGDVGQHIFGNGGDDVLIGGKGDVLAGGAGADQFHVAEDAEVYILDLQPDELIVIEYEGVEPEIELDATGDGLSILANGLPIAHLQNTFSFDLENVRLRQIS